MSNPKYPADTSFSPAQRITDLIDFVSMSDHEFWPDDVSLLDVMVFDHSRVLGVRQLTDVYLLSLAVHHSGRLVTFDERIPISAVRMASAANLSVI